MPDAVADTGPLIHLDEIKMTRALGIFRKVLVPEPVAGELTFHAGRPGAGFLRTRGVQREALQGPERTLATSLRRSGWLSVADASALAMAHHRKTVLLTDDLDLRDAAAILAVRPVGTIGILIRAATTDVLTASEAHAALDALLEHSSLFITRPLLERVKRAIGGGRQS